jgi:hypothetical protein
MSFAALAEHANVLAECATARECLYPIFDGMTVVRYARRNGTRGEGVATLGLIFLSRAYFIRLVFVRDASTRPIDC